MRLFPYGLALLPDGDSAFNPKIIDLTLEDEIWFHGWCCRGGRRRRRWGFWRWSSRRPPGQEAVRLQVSGLAANSTALRNSKHISPDALLQLTFDACRVLTRECKTSLQKQFHAAVASGSLISSAGQCHEVRSKPNQVPDEHVHEFKSTPSIIKLDWLKAAGDVWFGPGITLKGR